MSSADAVDREAAWLRTSGDGLPALLKVNGGPWDVVQAYPTRTPPARQTAIYLRRGTLTERRFAQQRKIVTHQFRARLYWPIGASTTATGIWETEQRAFDAAVEQLLARVRGTYADHTHGGRFLSAAEDQSGITVAFDDPTETAHGGALLRADCSWSADDPDFTA